MYHAVTFQIDQDGAEPIPASKRKIVTAQIHNRASRNIWQIHDVAQVRRARGLSPQASGESGSPVAAGSQSTRSNVLAATDRHPGPRLHKSWKPLGTDFL